MKIEKLTTEQEKLLNVYRDKWLEIGLSTKPANKVLAEDALKRCYKVAGLKEPKQIIWTTSPLAGSILVGLLKDDKFIKSILIKAKINHTVKMDLGASVGASVWASVWDSVRDSVWDSVGASVRDSVGASVWASVWDSVKNNKNLNNISEAIYGQHDANWLGFYDYFREVCNLVKETDKLVPLIDLSKHSNWMYLYKNIAIISEKPISIKLNEQNKLHCINGPALEYKDGFSIYSINGKRIVEGTEEYKQLLHSNSFNKKMDGLLNET